jgi:hypothetical protein
MIRHVIPKGNLQLEHKRLVIEEIMALPNNRAHLVQCTEYRRKRSTEQNAFLHAVPLKIIADHTGHDVEDMKTYLLGECFGWQGYEIMGSMRKKPVKRSSELDTSQFSFFMEWIESWAAQNLELIIPRPNEYLIAEDTK